jgi:hypothetical protein
VAAVPSGLSLNPLRKKKVAGSTSRGIQVIQPVLFDVLLNVADKRVSIQKFLDVGYPDPYLLWFFSDLADKRL